MRLSQVLTDGQHVDSLPPSMPVPRRRGRSALVVVAVLAVVGLIWWGSDNGWRAQDWPVSTDYRGTK